MSPRVERIEDPATFAALEAEWNELLQDSQSDGLFLTWEWLHTWWKHLGGNRRLALLSVREGKDLIGLAPLAMRPARLPGLAVPSLGFLGSGTVGSDYLDVILRRGCERQALDALAESLNGAGLQLDLVQVRTDSMAHLLAGRLGRHGWLVAKTPTHTCPFIPLDGRTWTSYHASLGRAHRANTRRKLEQALARGGRLQLARTADERRQAFAILLALHGRRWGDRSEAFYSGALVDFHEEITALALERGWLRLSVLRLSDTAMAAVYSFRYGTTVYYYQAGFDPAYAKQSPGLVALGLSIKAALEEGAREYDLLHGDEHYKQLWTRQGRRLSRLELYPVTVRQTVYATARATSRAARRLTREVLPTPVASWLDGLRRRHCRESA